MKQAMLSQPRVVAGLAALLFVTSLLPTRWVQRITAVPHDIVMAVLTPVSSPLNTMATTIRSGDNLQVLSGSDEKLQEKLLEMRALLDQTRAELSQTRKRLKKLTRVRQELSLGGVGLLPAHISDVAADNQRLTINVGRRDGVELKMAVTDGGNLIGRVSRVGASTADVRPIVAAGTRLAVSIRPSLGDTDARATVASLHADNDGRSFIGQVDGSDPVRAGDLAQLDDGGWPAEVQRFVVGVVREVSKDESDPALSKRIVIQTIKSFGRIRVVEVVMPADAASDDNLP